MPIISRKIENTVLDTLKSFPVVYLNGPRQAGKTTLAKVLLNKKFKANFITFDDWVERVAAKQNPLEYIQAIGTPLIIDEVQLVPEIFRPLKKIVDENRQKGLIENLNSNGQYLLTGSANLVAMPELANAMVGRMATLTLLPLNYNEILGTSSNFIERCFNKDFTNIRPKKPSLIEAIRQASFPEASRLDDNIRNAWYNNYIQKITLEDPQFLYNLDKAESMPLLLSSLAIRAGSLVNDANISREIGLSSVSVRKYRGLLNDTFVTYSLKPWHRAKIKRLVKSPKIYFHDTMLLCHLLGQKPEHILEKSPHKFGHILENFIFTELLKNIHASGSLINLGFYQTNDGKEVDFVLEKNQKIIAIEVKNSEQITSRDISGIKTLQQSAGKEIHCGIVLCNTPRVIPIDKNIYLLPINALWQ